MFPVGIQPLAYEIAHGQFFSKALKRVDLSLPATLTSLAGVRICPA